MPDYSEKEKISQKYGLLGYPLAHTLSPRIHERLFELSGKSGREYGLYEISPDALEKNISALKNLNGFNVTIPHKVNIIQYINSLDESARRYGAVNCVVNGGGETKGYNTDCEGFLRSLEAEGIKLGGKVLQIGCGGVGRMTGIEAVLAGADLTVSVLPGFEPTAEAVVEEAAKAGAREVRVVCAEEISGGYDLLINASPVGMYPDVDKSPVSEDVIKRCGAVFDVIYNPNVTKLMETARRHSIKTVGGMAMLVWQAAAAHEIWEGSEFSGSDISEIIKDMEKLIG